MSIKNHNMASHTGGRSYVQRSPNGRPSHGNSNIPCATPTHHWNSPLPNSMVFTSRRQGRWSSENCRPARFSGQSQRGEPSIQFGDRSYTTEANVHQASLETVPIRSRFSFHRPSENVKKAAKDVEDSSDLDSGTKEHPIQKLYRTLAKANELDIKGVRDLAAKADQQSAEQAAILEDEIQLDKRKLVFNYLPNYVDEWFLRELCGGKEIGDLVDCRVARRRLKGQPYGTSCGYAFLTYTDVESAERAKAAFDKFKLTSRSLPVGTKVDDVSIKELKVSYCRPSHAAYKDTNVFVTGIPCYWTREQVHQLFAQHGPITAEKTAPRGQCKCFKVEGEEMDWAAEEPLRCGATDWAFVRYTRRDSAEKAIRECSGMQLSPTYPRILKVTFANNCKSGLDCASI